MGVYRVGLCTSRVGSLTTVVLAVGLYVAVRPVEPHLAMTALLFRLAEAVIGAVGILFSFAVLSCVSPRPALGRLAPGS